MVGVFPDDAALLRLAACVLIEAHDEWAAGDRRYLSEASMSALADAYITHLPTANGGPALDTTPALTA